ncbi:MAG: ATP-binding cassette domain-containing protein [Propionibacteriaceae bacterium]|jgi:ABC-type lipoprotein export system ATPase subunit|nr:ATP-binding cassette domain-containing protein [Propionibacteriaceae bacterium]
MNTSNLVVDSLSLAYTNSLGETLQVVTDLSFRVEPGQLCVLSGRSGSGKTSVIRALVGLLAWTAGSIKWGGIDLATLSETERADQRRKLTGYVDQEASLIPELSIVDNLLLPHLPDGRKAVLAAKQDAVDLLKKLGLDQRASWTSAKLSGGERSRAALVRGLAAKTGVIVTDEPTASVDRKWADKVIELLLAHAHDDGGMVIAASHDPGLAAVADVLVTLD